MSTDASIEDPTAYDRHLEVLRPDLPQRLDVLRVRLHRVGDALRPTSARVEALVDREHFAVESVELTRAGGAEPAEADDEDGSVIAACSTNDGPFHGQRIVHERDVAATAAASVTVPTRPMNIVSARTRRGRGGSP